MGVELDAGYAEFVEYHELQLRNVGLPQEAWRQVYEKIQPRTVHDIDSGIRSQESGVVAVKRHQPYSSVYVVPHQWSGDGGPSSYAALNEDIEQPAKLSDLVNITPVVSKLSARTEDQISYILQETGSSDAAARQAYKKFNGDMMFAIAAVAGSANADEVSDGQKLADKLNLPGKATILTFDEFKSAVTEGNSEHNLELMYNDYVRKKQQELGEDGAGTTSVYRWEDDAEDNVITVTIPVPAGTKRGNVVSKITSKHWTFGIKGQQPIIYGNFQGVVQPDECTWYFEKGTGNIVANIQKADTEVFLWQNLIVGEEKISEDWLKCDRERKLVEAMDSIWYKALTYQAVTPGGKQAHSWYLPPPTVTNMPHSKNPKFRLAPFWSCYGGKIITLLWPIRNVEVNDTCTLDKYPLLFPDETELQREARQFAATPESVVRPLPPSFSTQYDDLLPPHSTELSDWNPDDGEALSESDEVEELVVVTTLTLTDSAKQELVRLGIKVTSEEVPGAHHWKQGREDRKQMTNVNSFDPVLTNLIRLNLFIRSSFGNTSWWPSGFHLNKELGALLASPPSWEGLWLLRCAEGFAASVVTNHPARLARMCENSLIYFAQPYVDSLTLEHCQCTLEYTVVVRDRKCFLSDIPAVHKARLPQSPEENLYLPDHFIPRSDGTHFPSFLWPKFLIEFSMQDAWPVADNKVQHIVHDLLAESVQKLTGVHCYGVQVIVTPELDIKVVGINPSPTYFPSPEHLANAWRLLYCRTIPVVRGFRNVM